MFDLLFLGVLLFIAYLTGTYTEKKHLTSIRQREQTAPKIPVLNTETGIPVKDVTETRLVSGSTVVGVDYFRHMLGGLINLFGGRISVFESALDRARREALLRMRQEANGADFIGCVRYETCILSENQHNALPRVAVLVYGTAFFVTPS